MKKLFLLMMWEFLQTVFVLPAAEAQERMQIALTKQDYPPFILYNQPTGGLLTDVVRESYKLAQVDVNFIEVPNNRAITGVMQGFYDGSYGWGHSTERDIKLLYSNKPLYSLHIVFFQRNDTQFNWNTLADLANVRIGTVQGNHYSDEFSALSDKGALKTDVAPSDISNFRKLLMARVDLIPIDVDSGHYLLKNFFSADERRKLIAQQKAISVVPVYLVIRKDLPRAKELMARFDSGYQQLIDSGQLTRMIEAHKDQLRIQP